MRRRFGKNAAILEYEGDGSFLGALPAVKSAHVYENYAEVLLRDGHSPNELLPELARRLEIRKFEIVQPSLNAIFLEIVGGKNPAQKEAAR